MKKSKETRCVQCEQHGSTLSEGINTPIYPSSSFEYEGLDEIPYPRYFNTPNQQLIAQKIASLEEGEDGLVFSSGMAAISTACIGILGNGNHVIVQDQLYGGTLNFIKSEFKKLGFSYSIVDFENLENVQKAIRKETRLLFFETPSNPLLKIIDIKGIADLASKKNLLTVIDNTFATPVNQNPISLGVDVVIHSGTKYLGGHSDLCFGALVTSAEIKKAILSSAINLGGSLNALDCYLIERSIKTLSLRVKQQNENAMKIAQFLSSRDEIKSVYYPGLSRHPQHQLACRQMSGFGGMMSFELEDETAADRFLTSLELIRPALSLGGVETIISSPAKTSHAKISPQDRGKLGIGNNLLRLSVGIEAAEDLIDDLEKALSRLQKSAASHST